ncbi:hypothetical protein DCO17_08405 [Polynucleobacter tropicus]|uniref:Uncharacterized protein n=1 Tax=Polynucleobacter tropicus TaxID=1743174 RepID=A0A6M9Q7J8_9BURK|nr:hypothetical protein [Polynucleobacter tropicus]QKM65253.1 hypothetical protein DCO17_08405 [Polynucleobacter tropicus]
MVNSQVVILKPGQAPVIEKGYAIKPQANNVDVKSLRTVDPVYRAPGAETGSTNFAVTIRGVSLPFTATTTEQGMQIKPLSAAAARYVEGNQAAVVRNAVGQAVNDLGAKPENFKTIYINFN